MTLDRKRFLRCLGTAAVGVAAGAGWSRVAPALQTGLPAYKEEAPERFWAAVREHYDIDPTLTYLNTGGLGPAPVGVQRLVDQVSRQLQHNVETGHAQFELARGVVARFLGVAPDEVAFVRNATEANGIIAAGLPLRPGDEVIFESHAHPGGSFSWLHRQAQGIVVKVFEPDPATAAGNLARIEALLTPRTRVVQVSHVTAPTGLVLPVADIAALCRARGLWCHVDGAQSVGMLARAIGDLGVDSYAISGHKWLGAPHETGVLYVRRERLTEVQPTIVGAHSGESIVLPGELRLRSTAARFEYGTRAVSAALALGAAAEWHEQVGRDRIAARGRALCAQLRAGLARWPDIEVLTPADPALSGSMLTWRTPRLGYQELFDRLFRDHRIRCRPVTEQGLNALRVSFHLFNHPAQVDRLLQALETALRAT